MPRPTDQPSSIGKRDSHDTRGSENPPTATQEVDNQKDTAGAHGRRQDRGGGTLLPCYEPVPGPMLVLRSEAAPRRNHGHAVTNPRMRACSTGVFGSCLRPCASLTQPLPPQRNKLLCPNP